MPDESTDPRIVRHLLGQLPDADEAEVLRRRAEDPGFEELCQAIEDELIDDYVQGRLAADETRRFEELFLTTSERVRKLEYARVLLRSFDPPARRANWRLGWLTLAAAAVICIISAYILLLRPTPSVASFTLVPGVVRDMTPLQTLHIRRSTTSLDLHLPAYPSANDAILKSVGSSRELWRQNLTPRPGDTEVLVPAGPLIEGDYLLILEADRQPVASFFFRLLKQ